MAHSTTNAHHPREPRTRQGSTMKSEIMVLLAMCTFAFIVLGVVVALKMLPDSEIQIGRFLNGYFDVRDENSLSLGKVKLGTTIDHVRNRYNKAVKGITQDGSITLAFLDGEDKYIVWYGEDGPNHVAYKARQTQLLTGTSEDDFIGSIAERYGAPSLASCSQRVADGLRDCHFSWWIPGEVRLDVNSRQDTRLTNPPLKVTLQITDTRMAGRLQRSATHSESAAHY